MTNTKNIQSTKPPLPAHYQQQLKQLDCQETTTKNKAMNQPNTIGTTN